MRFSTSLKFQFLAAAILLSAVAVAYAANTSISDSNEGALRPVTAYGWDGTAFRLLTVGEDGAVVVSNATSMQIRADYGARTDGQPVYQGQAPAGTATTGTWLVYKFTYDGNDQMTLRQSAESTWDDRASATYQ